MSCKKEDFIEILSKDSSRATADAALRLLKQHPERFKDVIDICFETEYPMPMRCSRVVQLYCEMNRNALEPWLSEVVIKTMKSQIDGVKRNILKALGQFTDTELLKDDGILLSGCFDLVADQRETIAVRAMAMDLLYNLSKVMPELRYELRDTLELQKEGCTPALENHINNIMKRIV